MEFGCSWNRMHSLELQSPFHQVKGRGRVNQSRTNENYSECWLIKLKATFKISAKKKKVLANVPPLSYFFVNLAPGLILISDKSRNARIPQVSVGAVALQVRKKQK